MPSLVRAWEVGKEVEVWLNTTVLPPMGRCLRMELEEIAWGYVLLAKKMYFGRMYPAGPAGPAGYMRPKYIFFASST